MVEMKVAPWELWTVGWWDFQKVDMMVAVLVVQLAVEKVAHWVGCSVVMWASHLVVLWVALMVVQKDDWLVDLKVEHSAESTAEN